jgi:hypothetical protein
VLDEITRVYSGQPFTLADLVVRSEHDEDLRAALAELANTDKLDPRRIGYAFRAAKNRIIDGKFLTTAPQADSNKKSKKWIAHDSQSLSL